jgi:hypothetical protein
VGTGSTDGGVGGLRGCHRAGPRRGESVVALGFDEGTHRQVRAEFARSFELEDSRTVASYTDTLEASETVGLIQVG